MIYEFNRKNFKNYEELMIKVREVHKQLFPNASIETQCAKFEEEYNEAANAEGMNFIKELADMFIVACGIGNFNLPISNFLCGYIVNKTLANENSDLMMPLLMLHICNKMNKNQERIWNETESGYYKHQVCDND